MVRSFTSLQVFHTHTHSRFQPFRRVPHPPKKALVPHMKPTMEKWMMPIAAILLKGLCLWDPETSETIFSIFLLSLSKALISCYPFPARRARFRRCPIWASSNFRRCDRSRLNIPRHKTILWPKNPKTCQNQGTQVKHDDSWVCFLGCSRGVLTNKFALAFVQTWPASNSSRFDKEKAWPGRYAADFV